MFNSHSLIHCVHNIIWSCCDIEPKQRKQAASPINSTSGRVVVFTLSFLLLYQFQILHVPFLCSHTEQSYVKLKVYIISISVKRIIPTFVVISDCVAIHLRSANPTPSLNSLKKLDAGVSPMTHRMAPNTLSVSLLFSVRS